MSLKNTLLLASLGATMVSCNHVQYQSLPSEPTSQESKNLELSRSGRKEQCFQENYQCLCNNVDDAFFVLGDAQMIRETLLYLASTPLGRDIISGLSDGNIKIKSKYFMQSSIGGYYAHKDNSVNLPVRDISPGNEISLTYTLGHELVHAYQRSQGIEVNNQGFSVKQAALVEQLKEAHARACHLVMRETFSQLDVSGSEINGSLEYFMEQNLDRRLRRRMFADNQEHPNYRAKKEDYPFYLLQEALKKCNGNREKAEKIMVGQLIEHFMSNTEHYEVAEWRKNYVPQIVRNTSINGEEGRLTAQGNLKELNKILDYFCQEYDVDRHRINQLNLPKEGLKQLDDLEKKLLKDGKLSTQKETYASISRPFVNAYNDR